MGRDDFVALIEGQHASRVRQGMDHHGGVLARLHDLVEVANGALADS